LLKNDRKRGAPPLMRPEQFARVVGTAGNAPRWAGVWRVLWPFFALWMAAGYLLRAAWPHPSMSAPAIGACFLGLAGVLAWLVTRGRERLASFLKGAQGEEWVARTLGFLPHGYHVYHGLQMHPSRLNVMVDYDHVVVGPTGIFLIETKHWHGPITVRSGKILYNDSEPDRPPLEQVRRAASQLRKELAVTVHHGVDVQPVLCFVDGQLPDGRIGVGGISVCTHHTLMDVLQEQPDHLLPQEIIKQTVYVLDQRVNAVP
jgi:hypothetical protein